jgi:nicotinate-nucleotide adenylyltransferase
LGDSLRDSFKTCTYSEKKIKITILMGKRKIGFFGGTFDPIHFGHLNLALSMLEIQGLDEVLFCPAGLSPHKLDEKPSIAKEHRKKCIEIAIEPIKKFKLLDNELQKIGPSYTIDTIRELLSGSHKNDEIRLILGEDILGKLSLWKDIELLLSIAPPLIGSRQSKVKNSIDSLSPSLIKTVNEGMVSIPMLEISSTTIRQRLRERKYCGFLVPSKVLDYIYEHHLYY